MNKLMLTQEGVKKIKAELEHVKTVKVPYVEKRLKDATEFGYPYEITDAKNEREFYNQRIVMLEDMLGTAKVI